MRIVVINATTDLYGANRILSLAMKALPDNCRKQLLVPELDGPLVAYLKKNNPEVELIPCEKMPIIQRKMFSPQGIMRVIKLVYSFYLFLKTENEREKIDLLYVNTLSNFFALPVARWLKIKSITHVHEILESPRRISNFINKYGTKWSTAVLAVSDAVKQNLLRASAVVDHDKISVIHNGIADLFDPQLGKDKGFQKCMITLIGRIKPEKGIWYFLEALDLVQAKEHIHVRIIGGPAPFGEAYVEKLKADIQTKDYEIDYLPFIPDIKRYLNETDILVVPSIMKDPFPTTVLEGMSAAKPVIATGTGGAAEAIDHEQTGYIIAVEDPKNFAAIMDKLILDRNLREEIGEKARKKYLNQFSLEIFNKNLRQYFEQQLGE